MAEAPGIRHWETPRAARAFDSIPLSAVKTALVAATGLLLVFLVLEASVGRFGPLSPELASRLPREIRLGVVLSLVLAYLIAANRSLRLATRRNFTALGPLLGEDRAQIPRLAERACSPSPFWGHVSAGMGVAVVILLASLVDPEGFAIWFEPRYWIAETAWHWAVLLPIGWLAGWLTVTALHASLCFAEVARRPLPIDLFDPRPLAPFVRQGMHTALLWLGLVAILSLNLVNQGFGTHMALVMVLAATISIASLLSPMLGIQRPLRERKAQELEWIRTEIRGAREQLASRGAAKTEAAARMPGLLAYERRVAEVSEWPLDAPTRLRFALYLVIPLGSWLGGAFVERIVSSVLD